MTGGRSEAWWARRAAERFGLAGALRRVASGMDTTFMLTTHRGDRVAIRVGALPIRTRDALDAEATWIRRLAGHELLRVPEVCATHHGDAVVDLHDGTRSRHAMALSWVSGRKARARVTRSHARRLGQAVAALHVDARTHDDDRTKVKDWLPRICGVGDLDTLEGVAGPEAPRIVRKVEAEVAAACAELGPDGFGLVNRDIGAHNTVWDRADHRPGLFDFNDTGWGPFASDLARYLHGLRWREQGETLVADALGGYQEVAALPEGWADHGQVFEAACHAFAARHLAPQLHRRGPETLALIRDHLSTAATLAANDGDAP